MYIYVFFILNEKDVCKHITHTKNYTITISIGGLLFILENIFWLGCGQSLPYAILVIVLIVWIGVENMFDKYKNGYEQFCEFNKLVINMPRHQFGKMNILFAKDLAIVLDGILVPSNMELTIINLYVLVHSYLNKFKPNISEFIYGLFDLEAEPYQYYRSNDGKARDFRHLVMIMRMWGMLEPDENQINKINYNICKEFFTLNENEQEGLRAKIIGMDIIDNPMFITLDLIKDRIKKNKNFSYKPAISILKYIKEIARPVSQFEISNLLGIIAPSAHSSNELFDNAIKIGKQMPNNILEHQNWFFKYMNWYDEYGNLFRYKSSQAPHFKFNSFLLFMEDLNLIKKLPNESFVLTAYSEKLLKENIPAEVVELEKYISIAEESYSDKDLADLILYNIKPSLLKYVAQNEDFITAMNFRSINNPKYQKGKKVRNRLIAELAKIKANYTCQISKKPTFKDIKGNNYVESHHIIEFNGEDGPDIVDNLLVISPFYHSLLHHACEEEIVNLYDHIRKNNIVNIEMFKKMYDKYHCIEEKHIEYLLQKKLISTIEFNELKEYITKN